MCGCVFNCVCYLHFAMTIVKSAPGDVGKANSFSVSGRRSAGEWSDCRDLLRSHGWCLPFYNTIPPL